MKYQKTLSKLRHAVLAVQGKDLKQVLIRAAAKHAESVAQWVYTAEEIFHELKDGIYLRTNEMSWDEAFNIVSDAAELEALKVELIYKPSEKFEWGELKNILLEGLEERDIKIIGPLLENEHNYMLADAAAMGNTNAHNIAGFNKLLIPIVRRIFGDMPVRDIVGVQPMTGPVGLVYTLRYRQKNEETGEWEDFEADSFENAALTDNTITAEDLEGKKGKRMTLDVVTNAVEASSRKLQAGWTIEALQDLNAMNGLDIEAEMTAALADEIRSEFTAAILKDLKALSTVEEIKLKGSYKKQLEALGIHVNRAANEIARKTRRGAGNFMVVSYLTGIMLEKLAEKSTMVYAPVPKKERSPLSGFEHIGTLNGTIRVYSSLFVESDEVLVGYKGGNGDTDTGYIYAPYMPLMSSGVVVHPKTFQPVVTLMTRYGKHAVDNASHYYTTLKLDSDIFSEIPEMYK